jgi:hypothetical protein
VAIGGATLLIVDDMSRFRTVGEWYAAYRGRVPIQMAAGLERLMSETGCTFPEAYARLVERGSIIETDGTSARGEHAGQEAPAGNSDGAPEETPRKREPEE